MDATSARKATDRRSLSELDEVVMCAGVCVLFCSRILTRATIYTGAECGQRRVEINNVGSAEQHADFLTKRLRVFFFFRTRISGAFDQRGVDTNIVRWAK